MYGSKINFLQPLAVLVVLALAGLGCPSSSPELRVSENSHSFAADQDSWSFDVWNGGAEGSTLTFTVTAGPIWMEIDPNSGQSEDDQDRVTIDVTLDRAALREEPFSGSIQVDSNGGTAEIVIDVTTANGGEGVGEGEGEDTGDDGWSSGGTTGDPLFKVTFANDVFFSAAIEANPEIDPNSDAMIARLAGLVADEDNVLMVTQEYTYPVYFADADTPRYSVRMTADWRPEVNGSPVEFLVNTPIPAGALPDPVPLGEPDWGDGDLVVIDTVGGYEYDFWLMAFEDGAWTAGWGNRISLDGNGIYPGGLSAKGSGFAITLGLIWPEELAAGRIEHKLFCSLDPEANSNAGPVAPATESDGLSSHPDAIPEGAVLQLDPALDLDALGLTPVEKIVARAMQEYGIVHGDNNGGGSIMVYGVHPLSYSENPWPALMNQEPETWNGYVLFRKIPVDRLRILKLPPISNPDTFLADESIYE